MSFVGWVLESHTRVRPPSCYKHPMKPATHDVIMSSGSVRLAVKICDACWDRIVPDLAEKPDPYGYRG